MKKAILIVFIFSALLCKKPDQYFRGQKIESSALEKGKSSAEKHCSTCHITPPPDALTRENTNFTLSYMGLFLGIGSSRHVDYDPAYMKQYQMRHEYLSFSNLIPAEPAMPKEEWLNIRNYYLYNAPVKPAEPAEVSGQINYQIHQFITNINEPGISMMHYDAENRHIFIGYAWSSKLGIFTETGEQVQTLEVNSAPVSVSKTDKGYLVALIGDLLGNRPLESPAEIIKLHYNGKKYTSAPFLKKLPRMAHIKTADFDNDGLSDILVPGFGNLMSGNILWFRQNPDGTYTRYSIDKELSAVSSAVRDFNNDGYSDLLILAANAREGLFLYMNDRKGGFIKKELWQRPPAWGYTWMQLQDLDHDGTEEVIITNGDNADTGPYNTVKPYHGLRIYGGDIKSLEQKFFQPLQGAYSFNIADLNDDKKPDIFINSYYPDARIKPTIQQLILINTDTKFKPYRVMTGEQFRPVVSAVLPEGNIVVGTANIPLTQLIDGTGYGIPYQRRLPSVFTLIKHD